MRPGTIWGDGPVLVPGCGRGHDAVLLHEATGLDVIALDLAPAAIAKARTAYGDREGIRWMEGDFFDHGVAAAYPVSSLFEHTCFCAIDPAQRTDYVEAAWRWLQPAGRVVAVFFLDPPPRESGEPGPPFGAERGEIRALFGERFEIVRETVPRRSHAEREGREWVVEMIKSP